MHYETLPVGMALLAVAVVAGGYTLRDFCAQRFAVAQQRKEWTELLNFWEAKEHERVQVAEWKDVQSFWKQVAEWRELQSFWEATDGTRVTTSIAE